MRTICQECEAKLNVIIIFIIKVHVSSEGHKSWLGFDSCLVNVKSKWKL